MTLKKYLLAMAFGALLALLAMERWRRVGSSTTLVVVTDEQPDAAEPPATLLARVRAAGSHTSQSVLAGAKADLAKVRQVPARVRPGHEDAIPTANEQSDEDSVVQ